MDTKCLAVCIMLNPMVFELLFYELSVFQNRYVESVIKFSFQQTADIEAFRNGLTKVSTKNLLNFTEIRDS